MDANFDAVKLQSEIRWKYTRGHMIASYFAFGCLGIFWGTNFLFMKMAVSVLQPLQIVWCRVLFGAVPILLIALSRKSLHWSDFKRAHHFIVLALLANVLPFFFLVKGTQYLKSGIAGVLAGTVPLVTAVLATLFLPSEKIGTRKVIGLLLGFLGVGCVAQLQNAFSNGLSDEFYGVTFMLLGALSFASVIVYTKKVLAPFKITALQLASYQTLFASVILALITPTQGLEVVLSSQKIFWTVIVGLGLFGTGISYVLFYYIIEKLGPVTASSVYYIPPVIALSLGAIFANESISPLQAIGTLFIFAGVYFARARVKKEHR